MQTSANNCFRIFTHTYLYKVISLDIFDQNIHRQYHAINNFLKIIFHMTLTFVYKYLFFRYDLLFGVVTSESLMRFSASDVQSGFEGNRRDRILRTYVRNAYTRHLSEIFYTVANEYTDWERTVFNNLKSKYHFLKRTYICHTHIFTGCC